MKLCFLVLIFLIAGTQSKNNKCFPKNFLFGTATSSYQIEGAWNESGKGENIWDWFTHNYPSKIADGSNGDVADDSYYKYEDDIDLLHGLGVDFYRFSLSWSRILPDGTVNNINQDGVDYYLRIFKRLKQRKIEPLVTLYHWDLPLSLHHMGGWTNSSIVDYFVDYATLCYKLFGDYVKYWVTLNEPMIQCIFGYGYGTFAPGFNQSGTMTYTCAHYTLLAHAKAYHAYNDYFKARQGGKVGLVLVAFYYEPLTESAEDVEASERATQFLSGLWAHPLYIGNYPQVVINRVGNLSKAQGLSESRLKKFTDQETQTIKGSYDYFGLNYYTTYLVTSADYSDIENTTISYDIDKAVVTSVDPSWVQAKSPWLYDVPYGLRQLLRRIKYDYGNPEIIITENGWSDGRTSLNDPERITYLEGHLCSVLQAKYLDDVNVAGYTEWSLLDNFEWNAGYTEGFGLVAVDFDSPNKTRTPKSSYYWYKKVVTSRCIENCKLR